MKYFRSVGQTLVLLTFAMVCSLTSARADTYTVSGTNILKNGAVWCGGGVDAFDQFGPSNKGNWGVKAVREIIDDMSQCPINSSDGGLSTSIGYLHPLEDIVNNNRAQGQVTILCPFGWDTGNYKQILGNTPSAMSWYSQFKTRLAAIAAKFAGQSDVWFDVWNEPYAWDNTGFTESQWASDMNDLYKTIRAKAPSNLILIPGQAMDGQEKVLVDQGANFLAGKSNVVATIHCYNGWTGNTQANSESRIQSIRKAGWALIFGEVGQDQWVSDCTHLLNASVTQQVTTLGWSWDAGDGSRLVSNGQATTWGNQFLPYLPKYKQTTIPFGRTISLKALANGLYVCADNAGSSPLIANRTSASTWEQYVVIDAGGGYVALQALANNMYVCADNAGANPLIANKSSIGTWESFQWVDQGGGNISLRARVNNMFVCADNYGKNPLIANRTSVSTWETFQVTIY